MLDKLLRYLQTAVAAVCLTIPLLACNDETGTTTHNTSGDYELIHAVIRTSELPETSASRYDIDQERDNLLITLVIKDKATGNNVPAEVEVDAFNAAGQLMEIEVEELVANDMVSYVGTLDVELPAILDFHVQYRPQGEPDAFEVEFREDFQNLQPR